MAGVESPAVVLAPTAPESPPPSSPPPPRTRIFPVALKDIPRRGPDEVNGAEVARPLWTLDHYHPLGHPAISADGRWLALNRAWNQEGKTLVLFDLANRRGTEHAVPAPGLVSEPVFSRDSREIWSVANSATGFALVRWSLPTMSSRLLPLGSGKAHHAAFTHARDRVVVLRADGIAAVFDLASGKMLHEVAHLEGKANFYFHSPAISPDDEFVSSGIIHPGNDYVRWRLADGRRVEAPSPGEHLSWGQTARTTRDGRTIFVAAHHELRALAADSGKQRATYPGNGLHTIHYQPTVDLIAAPVGQGETFALIDGASGQIRFTAKHAARPPAPLGYVNWAAVAPDGKTAYSASYFTLFAWDLAAPQAQQPALLANGTRPLTLLPSKDGATLIAVGETVDTWDLRSRRIVSTAPSWLLRGDRGGDLAEWRTGRRTGGVWRSGDAVHALRLDIHGARVYDLASEEPVLRLGRPNSARLRDAEADSAPGPLWCAPTSEPREWPNRFPYRSGYLHTAASPDGRHLVVTSFGGADPCSTLWSLESGRLLAVLADGSIGARTARFSPDGRRVAVASEGDGLAIFHLTEEGPPRLELIADASPGGGVGSGPRDVIIPTEDQAYLGTEDGALQSWRRGPGGDWHLRFEHRFTDNNTSAEFPAPVARLAISPSGGTLACALFNAAEQGSILIIDTETGAIRTRLDEHVSDLCFLDERTLATTGIRLWTID